MNMRIVFLLTLCFARKTRGYRIATPIINRSLKAKNSGSLYEKPPPKKLFQNLGILTSGFPPQQLLVPVVKFFTFNVWKLMMQELVTHDSDGRFIRESFEVGNNPQPLTLDGRYRLYLGGPCPWCHRVSSTLALLKLKDAIKVTNLIDDAEKASKGGWILPPPPPDSDDIQEELKVGDLSSVYNFCYREVAPDGYKGRATAPLLIDETSGKIVSNESNEIMVLLNDFARTKGEGRIDLRPQSLEDEINGATKHWFDLLWNGVYKCGFATSQKAYDEAAAGVLTGLEEMNNSLGETPFLVGGVLTEVDVKAFSWVVRHDHAYSVIFKSPGGRIAQYKNIASWVKRLVELYPDLEEFDLPDACGSYFRQLFMLNFGRVVPYMPTMREFISGL